MANGQATRVKIGVAILIAALGVAVTLLHLERERALRAKLLMSMPDAVRNDPQLERYALDIGRQTYHERCVACHGTNLEGDALRGIPALSDRDWLYGKGRVGEIERIVLYGIRAGHSKTRNLASMPAFASPIPYSRYKLAPLRPDDIDDVTALVYSYQHPASSDESTLRRGELVYHGKGACFDCHADQGTGDTSIGAPNLTDAVWLYGDGSLDSIRQVISKGAGGVCPQWIGRMDLAQIRAVAVYVSDQAAQGK